MENAPQTLLNVCGITDEEARQIGLRLREKRTNTIDPTSPEPNAYKTTIQLAQALHIRKHYIEIIESGDWSELPHGGPGRSIVRMYARELGVDLPEFEKFKITQTMTSKGTPGNLKNIVECAREKQSEQNAGSRFHPDEIAHKFKSLFKFKNTKSHTSPTMGSRLNLKRFFVLGGSVFASAAIALLAFKSNDKPAVDTEIQSEPIAEETNAQQDAMVADANEQLPITADVNANTQPTTTDALDAKANTQQTPTADTNANAQQTPIVETANTPQIPTAAIANANTQQTPTPATANPDTQQTPTTVEATVKTEIPSTEQNKPQTIGTTQKTQIDILAPVVVRIETDGKQIVNGLTQPGTILIEFQKQAKLFLQDSSKVKLSYAGWTQERLSTGPRQRTIVLNAKKFSDAN